MSITFGTDPEFMIVDSDGKLKSAIGIVPGSKEEPYAIGGKHYAYYDNVLVECSINPAKTAEEAVANIRDCFQRLVKLINPYKLLVRSSATYPEAELKHKDALRFGCNPEFCAYDPGPIQPPTCLTPFRSAGGHIHIGFKGGDGVADVRKETNMEVVWNRLWVARMADVFIGIPSLFLDKDPNSKERRKLYGGAGSHRPCKYGVEYRSLSNFWLANPEYVKLMYDLSAFCAKFVAIDKLHEKLWSDDVDPWTVKSTIESWDMKKAKELLQVSNKYLPKSLSDRIEELSHLEYNDSTEHFYSVWNIKN